MSVIDRRGLLVGVGSGALALVLGGREALAQRRGGGSITFVTGRPPRFFTGDIRAWAGGHRTAAFQEDTANHVWRINMFVFMARPPNAVSLTLTWFRVQGRVSRYISNETINVADPDQRILLHSTTLRRTPGDIDPMETYEAQISINDARGARELARGRVRLEGVVEHRGNGVVDFTRETPPR